MTPAAVESTGIGEAEVIYAFRMVFGLTVDDGVERLQLAVGCVDRVDILTVSVGQTDSDVQVDFHVLLLG
jgi:hypothetical protein